jgi:hypothetical protein
MPNGNHEKREYGPHKYASHDGTSDCEFGCGCWMGQTRSGGPLGLDPFGKCPNNPTGTPIEGMVAGKKDYEYVVIERIKELELRAHTAEEKLKRVTPTKKQLVKRIVEIEEELFRKNQVINGVLEIMDQIGKELGVKTKE